MQRLFIFVALFAAHFVIPAAALADDVLSSDVLIMPVVGDVDARTGRGRRMATHVRQLVVHGLRAADRQGRLVSERCERVACVEAAIAETEGVETAILIRLFQDRARVTEVVVVVVRHSGRHGSARAPVSASTSAASSATSSDERAAVAAATSFALATALDDEGQVDELVALQITGSPQGAAVTVDGIAVGVLPVVTQVVRGTRRVAVAMFGYESRVRSIQVSDERALEVTLRALPESGPLAETHGPETHGPAETHGAEPHGSAEGSTWPSYVVGGGMVAAGVALWVSPILTLAGAGDYKASLPNDVVDAVGIDGGQIGLAVAGSLLAIAGVVLIVGGWLRTSGSVTNDGAMLRVEGSF